MDISQTDQAVTTRAAVRISQNNGWAKGTNGIALGYNTYYDTIKVGFTDDNGQYTGEYTKVSRKHVDLANETDVTPDAPRATPDEPKIWATPASHKYFHAFDTTTHRALCNDPIRPRNLFSGGPLYRPLSKLSEFRFTPVCPRCLEKTGHAVPTTTDTAPDAVPAPAPAASCPRCTGPLAKFDEDAGAGSRIVTDRNIQICGDCGLDEAVLDARGMSPVLPAEWPIRRAHLTWENIR